MTANDVTSRTRTLDPYKLTGEQLAEMLPPMPGARSARRCRLMPLTLWLF